jgi:thioredoxin reductase (NADPH)
MTSVKIVPIIGGGPAGMSCALWLKNYGLHPVIIERTALLGGMERASPYEDLWLLGRPGETARRNAEAFARHIALEEIETLYETEPERVAMTSGGFRLALKMRRGGPRVIESRVLVIATGTDFRGQDWVDGVTGACKLANAGRVLIGPAAVGEPGLDIGADVLIVGGGDNAFDIAHRLAAQGKRVTVAMRGKAPRAQPVLQQRIEADIAAGRVTIKPGVAVATLEDGPRIGVRFDDGSRIAVDRIVLCFGYAPNTQAPWIESLQLKRDGGGYLVVDGNAETSHRGVFAIGDVSNPRHPCAATAIAAGTMAAREILKRFTQT